MILIHGSKLFRYLKRNKERKKVFKYSEFRRKKKRKNRSKIFRYLKRKKQTKKQRKKHS